MVRLDRFALPAGWDRASPVADERAVLADLESVDVDDVGVTSIVARYNVLRAVLRARPADASHAVEEREAVYTYVARLGSAEWSAEADVLLEALLAAGSGDQKRLGELMVLAGHHALRQRHRSGAWTCYQAAYGAALCAGGAGTAAIAATAMARMAEAEGYTWPARVWHRRAAVLQRRAGG